MRLIKESLGALTSPAPDIHLNFAGYFFKDDLKHFAWAVSKKLEEGHICVHFNEIMNGEALFLKSTEDKAALKEHFLGQAVVSRNAEERKPFVVHNDRLYLHRYFHYESIILNRIQAFVKKEEHAYTVRKEQLEKQEALVRKLFASPKNSMPSEGSNTDWQLAAAITAALNNFTIITGGPGTGKTTTVVKVLALLCTVTPEIKVALAAPTGKAAARMAESLKHAIHEDNPAKLPVSAQIAALFQTLTPSTIHRLLRTVPESCHFQHNRENPLQYDVIIVDESSMLDVALFAKLLDAIDDNTRLIMLGDKDQLASVEAGSLFSDLCQAQGELNLFCKERIELINSLCPDAERRIQPDREKQSAHPLHHHIVELKHSHRFNGKEGIGRFSKAVILNEQETISEFITAPGDKQVQIDSTYSKALFEHFIEGYKDFIQEKDVLAALHKLNKLRVLCAVKEGEQGLYNLNRRIESYLHRKALIEKSGDFYVNRPIIVSKNFYQLELFNGDTGIIRPDRKGILRAWFEDKGGKPKPILPGYITQAETAYAMTIHKSQGSEFDKVLMVLPDTPNLPLLTRELLYTGVTRARTNVLIQAAGEVLREAARARVQRGSGIIERFLQ